MKRIHLWIVPIATTSGLQVSCPSGSGAMGLLSLFYIRETLLARLGDLIRRAGWERLQSREAGGWVGAVAGAKRGAAGGATRGLF